MFKVFTLSKLFIICVTLLLLAAPIAEAQRGSRGGQGGRNGGEARVAPGKIEGQIVTAPDAAALAFATIRLFSVRDSTMVAGASSDQVGKFTLEKLRFGRYYLTIKFIGFSSKTIDGLELNREQRTLDLGVLTLDADEVTSEGVVVEARRSNVEYKIDRKVINVDSDLAASSGTAVDVLQNVPSVQVDIDGNVSLRGSTGFIVMIDGRPTVLDAQDALQQIPAASIENIEVITNPSAKFDPDGTAGILNIVLKKQTFIGNSSLISLDVGQFGRIGGNALYSVRMENVSMFVGADYSRGEGPGTEIDERESRGEDLTSFVFSDGETNRIRERYNIRAGAEFTLTDADMLNVEASFGGRNHESENTRDFREWTSLDPQELRYTSREERSRGGDHFSSTLNYTRLFGAPGHKLTAQLDFRHRESNEEGQNDMLDSAGGIFFAARNTEDGPSNILRTSLDYSLPLGETDKLELGYQGRIGNSQDVTESFAYSLATEDFTREDEFSYTIDYLRDIHALYTMYAGELDNFGYQAGLRGEYVKRDVQLSSQDQDFTIDRWDLFPTAHVSYKISDDLQLMSSYSRRIERPRSWYLEPFTTRTDAFNLRRGNPDLLPEYADSYELGAIQYIGRSSISAELYHRRTENKTERIRTLIDGDEGVFLNTIENVGTDYATGLELMFDFGPADFWNVTVSGGGFRYEIETTIDNVRRTFESTNWTGRIKNDITLGETTSFELTFNVDSPSVSAQGEREGFYMVNTALRQQFFDKALSATLQVRDLFSTGRNEFTSIGDNFTQYVLSERDAPVVTLTLRLNINNYKQKRRGSGDDGDDF